MAYSELPWKSFLGHQAWSWTTLRRGNVFLLRLQTFFFIFVTFFITFTNVLLLLSRFFIFLWTFFLHLWRLLPTQSNAFQWGRGATTPKFVHSFGGSEPPLNTQFFWPTLIGGGRGQWLGGHHGECGARAYNGGLGAEPPVGSRAEPLVTGCRGQSPLKLKAFWSLDVQRSRQI